MKHHALILSLSILVSASLAAGCGDDPVCGDGVAEGHEACDDGNVFGEDGCSSVCVVEDGWDCSTGLCDPICQDGLTVAAEVCDPFDDQWVGYCSPDCMMIIGECGDGVLNEGAETCDDANTTNFDGCSSECEVELGFQCDDASPSACDGIDLEGTLKLGELDDAGLETFCSWLISTLGGSGSQLNCGDWIYTIATVSDCSSSFATSGFGTSSSCTISETEAYTAELGTQCALMEAPKVCR